MTEAPIPESETEAGALKAADLIRDQAKRAPDKAGRLPHVWRGRRDCLYVGKAKSIKQAHSPSMRRAGSTPSGSAMMVGLTRSMEFVITETEAEALLLECNLIKR
jgi:excinuclease ABC subunit C